MKYVPRDLRRLEEVNPSPEKEGTVERPRRSTVGTLLGRSIPGALARGEVRGNTGGTNGRGGRAEHR